MQVYLIKKNVTSGYCPADGPVGVEYVTIMDVLNSDSMIYYCRIRKTILRGDGLSAMYVKYFMMLFNIAIK